MKQLNITRLPADEYEQLRRLAADDDRSIASLVRLIIREYLDRLEGSVSFRDYLTPKGEQ